MKKATDGITELDTNILSSKSSYPEVDNSVMAIDKNDFGLQKIVFGSKVHDLIDNSPVRHNYRFNILKLFKPGEILNSFIEQ